jgi:thioredoxin reductase (NADPH)
MQFDIVIVGAGPAGLSCAIEAVRAGLSTLVLEKGSLVDSIRRFPVNVVWFSTPELLEIGDIPFVTPTIRPTRVDTLNYYRRVCEHYKLDVRYFDAVESVERRESSFLVTTRKGRSYEGRCVVIATGYFDHPVRLGVPGEDLPNVMHYYDEPFRYFGCDVAVVGGRNSAVEAALDLFRHDVRVTLIHRGETLSPGVKYWILPDIENRIKAGEIKAFFNTVVREFHPEHLLLRDANGEKKIKSDFTFVLTGFLPDVDHLRRFGISIEKDTLSPMCDENTFETNIPGLFVAGSIVAGKNNNKIFVENGRMHGKAIVEAVRKRV